MNEAPITDNGDISLNQLRHEPRREPNMLLDSLIHEAGMSYAGLAGRVRQVGKARGLHPQYDHASVRRWVRDHATPPRRCARAYLRSAHPQVRPHGEHQ